MFPNPCPPIPIPVMFDYGLVAAAPEAVILMTVLLLVGFVSSLSVGAVVGWTVAKGVHNGR